MTNAVLSTSESQLLRSVEKIVSPLIREGVFDNFEFALRALLLDYVDRQIAGYKNKNAEFESRHNQNFDSFTVSLKNRATPEQEDVWMDWESALVFLRKWQAVREQVTKDVTA